ncbi:MAG: response regulator [Acidobacteria bacterium]|jgi:DNA-binding NtrC family response regulator|nr:response regulator [Acidobacteriota bacterium]
MSIFNFKKQQANAKKNEDQTTAKKHTIMIVDDEEKQLNSLESLFSEECHVITALNGQEALTKIKGLKNPEELSVIISDQRMPMMTGTQLFQELITLTPKTSRILLTAYADTPAFLDPYEFVLKPFNPESFKNSVKRAIKDFESRK